MSVSIEYGDADVPATDFGVSTDETVPAPARISFTISDEVVMLSDPTCARAESIGALRTHMMAQHMPAGRRSLALCSPTRDVGCSALAVNLAVALAEGGIKTLLIDADMRHPAVDELITPSQPVSGLQQCLADGGVSFGDAIQFDVLPNLSILYAGGRAERPQELLSTTRFQQLIDLCLRDFDITIVDTPPSNVSADARRIATVVGYSMIVAGRDRTFVNDVKLLAEELQADNAAVIGSVLYQP